MLEIRELTVSLGGKNLLKKIDLTIIDGEQWAIVGESGSGKTLLAETLAGHHFFRGSMEWIKNRSNNRIVYVAQQHHFRSLSNTTDFYYQQRYNSYDAENSLTVKQWLGESLFPEQGPPHEIISMMGLLNLSEEPLIQLSNGENKRLQLAAALAQSPDLLVLDQPYVGLDKDARKLLDIILIDLIQRGIQILLLSSPSELPSYITHVAILHRGELVSIQNAESFSSSLKPIMATHPDTTMAKPLLDQFRASIAKHQFTEAVRMVHVKLEYEGRYILSEIDWSIKKGERWCLSGPNGAGKSSLLSLMTGDNPQAYANEIYLFNKRRGTGETIWEIKNKIGYVSPELHLYFEKNQSVHDVLASGFFDTIGLFRPISDEQENSLQEWARLWQLESLMPMRLGQLPASQQRLVLIARALVKFPPLLILDEPGQGLDPSQLSNLKSLVNLICEQTGLTLIYISHYREDIPECVNCFLELEKGRIAGISHHNPQA